MTQHHAHDVLAADAFAGLGTGKLAYVRQIRSEDLSDLFPDAPPVTPGLKLWALTHANGRPLLISDSREAAIANAAENDLMMVSVH
jgi:hypothetical protein